MSEDRSTSWPLFRESAVDLAAKLAEIPTAEAAAMAHEARDLAQIFLSWDTRKPENEARIARIRQLFDLNRRVMDFLAKRKSAPGAPRR
ncbi:MAG: hypothetical protein ABJE95_34670 [Byssovorax sp.]